MLKRYAIQNQPVEWAYISSQSYHDPFNDIELDVLFTDDRGNSWHVPAYWAGEQEWRVRFAAPHAGSYRFRAICSDAANPDLNDQGGVLSVSPYRGENPLLKHGALRVSADRGHLEHADGAPFLWLADTWWMSLCQRLGWPDDFQLLAADRVQKGFNVIQLVAGLYPDMPAFDPRGANEAGFPWNADYARVNPWYFDQADLRIRWLVKQGLAPCIVGAWGYWLPWIGVDRMKKHWRNLAARYGAYPVVWCLAGEGAMPYYLSKDKEADRQAQIAGWSEIARYLRQVDPYHRPTTIHSTSNSSARDQLSDASLIDFDLLQAGHGGFPAQGAIAKHIAQNVAREPRLPVINGEACYEGILEGSREEVQRFLFWSALLSGAAGFTYGANGIWQVNTREKPYGPSPHGASWGDTPWEDAYRLPGSAQIGLGKKLLERYPWARFAPHPEWIEPHAGGDKWYGNFAAGIPGQLRVFYLPEPVFPWRGPVRLAGLEPEVRYQARYVNPSTGQEHPLGTVTGASEWTLPVTPIMRDWLLILEA
jgi:hypothetical protein